MQRRGTDVVPARALQARRPRLDCRPQRVAPGLARRRAGDAGARATTCPRRSRRTPCRGAGLAAGRGATAHRRPRESAAEATCVRDLRRPGDPHYLDRPDKATKEGETYRAVREWAVTGLTRRRPARWTRASRCAPSCRSSLNRRGGQRPLRFVISGAAKSGLRWARLKQYQRSPLSLPEETCR